MKFKMISDTSARVQVKGSILGMIVQPNDKAHGGSQTVSKNGCWIRKDAGGWVTISAFGSGARAQEALTEDLLDLEHAVLTCKD